MEESNERLDAPALVRLYENAGTVMEFIELVAAEVKKRDERIAEKAERIKDQLHHERHDHATTKMKLKVERSKRAKAEREFEKAADAKRALIDAIVAMHREGITTPYEES